MRNQASRTHCDIQHGVTEGNQSVTTPQDKALRPRSATHGAVAAVGLAAFLLAVTIVRTDRPFGENMVHSALFIVGVTAAAIFLLDLIWRKVHLRASTGLDFPGTIRRGTAA